LTTLPFLGFAHNQHPTFYGSQKEYATQKVAKVKGPIKRKGNGQEKQFGTGNYTKLKYYTFLYLIFGKSILVKISSFSKTGPFSVMAGKELI